MTHSYVLTELVALAGARRLARPVTLAFVETVADDGTLHRRPGGGRGKAGNAHPS